MTIPYISMPGNPITSISTTYNSQKSNLQQKGKYVLITFSNPPHYKVIDSSSEVLTLESNLDYSPKKSIFLTDIFSADGMLHRSSFLKMLFLCSDNKIQIDINSGRYHNIKLDAKGTMTDFVQAGQRVILSVNYQSNRSELVAVNLSDGEIRRTDSELEQISILKYCIITGLIYAKGGDSIAIYDHDLL